MHDMVLGPLCQTPLSVRVELDSSDTESGTWMQVIFSIVEKEKSAAKVSTVTTFSLT